MKKGKTMKKTTKRVGIEKVKSALEKIDAAKALDISKLEDKIIVKIPRDIFLSNREFGKIHEKLSKLGGQYIEGKKEWEIEGS